MTPPQPRKDEDMDDEDTYIQADGLEGALIGFCWPWHHDQRKVAIYDVTKIIAILVERDGMTEEDAREFFEYNIAGAYIDPGQPIYLESTVTVEDGYQALLEWKQRTGRSATRDPHGAVAAIQAAKGTGHNDG